MNDTILVLAPHTDDSEFGCGGALARFARERKNIVCAVFSTCVDSIPASRPADALKIEFNKAMDYYNIPDKNRIIFDYKVRHFPEFRQNILDDLIRLNNLYSPDVVLAPSIHDIHQDHQTIAQESMRAFKKTTLLGYEEPWNNYTFNNQAYIELEEEDINKKINAIACYDTQKTRDYASDVFIRGLAKTHGIQIGKQYAEVFEVVRWLI